MDNIVTNVYAKFDRLWNEKALVDRKSDKQEPQQLQEQQQRSWPFGTGSRGFKTTCLMYIWNC